MQTRDLKEGSPLPTEHALCEKFACSRRTVRKALGLLEKENKICRRQGAGTFVADADATVIYERRFHPKLLALIVPNMTNDEIARFSQVLHHQAELRDCQTVYGVTNDYPAQEAAFIELCLRQHVDGVIKFATNPEYEARTREQFRFYGIPFVMMNDFWSGLGECHRVCYDEVDAVRQAVAHLASLGHRNMAMIDSGGWPRVEAGDAFLSALKRQGLPHEEERVSLVLLYNEMKLDKLYGPGGPRPTALVVAYSIMAPWVIRYLKTIGLSVPGDVSVVSLNGLAVERHGYPTLTAAMPPNHQMVDAALDILVNDASGNGWRNLKFKPGFHVGETSAPCASLAAGAVRGDATRS